MACHYIYRDYQEELKSNTRWMDKTIKKRHEYLDYKLMRPIEAPIPKDHPPLTILVNNVTWTLHYGYKEEMFNLGFRAFEDPYFKEIWLEKDCYTIDCRESVLHELMHVSLEESRKHAPKDKVFFYNNDENTFIEPMAPKLLQILHDNPDLANWLINGKY